MNESNYNFNSMDIIRFMFKHKWPIIIVTLIAAIASVVVSLTLPEKYKSTVVFYPKTQVSISHALETGQLIDADDHIMNFGDEEATEQLIQTLHSEDIRYAIIKKFDLMNHYEIDNESEYPRTQLEEEIRDNIKFQKTEFQAVRIEVLDTDPQMAADIANEIASLLDKTLNRMQNEVAIEILRVVEREHSLLLSEIEEIENSMNKLGSNPNNPKYISLNTQLVNENKRLSDLKSKLVEARVNANQDLPRKFTVAKAFPAEKKSYPIRWLISVITTISAFIFAVFTMLFIERYKDLLKFKS